MKFTEDRTLGRKDFLELLTGIAGGLGIPLALTNFVHAKDGPQENDVNLDDSYLVKGLTGMVRAQGWFDAHWGAGVLAGYYLCRDNAFGSQTTAAIKKQMDVVIQSRAAQFAPLTSQRPDDSLIDEVPQALRPAIEGGLRSHGHAVIFASLSTRALRDAPQMAQPTIIQGLCGLSHQIAKHKPHTPLDPNFVYADADTMIEATLDSLSNFKDLLGHPSVRRPNFTHIVTHTEALLNLEWMGYRDLAKLGHAGHKTHISPAVPHIETTKSASHDPTTLEKVSNADFWNNQTNQDRWRQKWSITHNPNGDWIAAGHLFKVLYSYHRLISRVEDKEKIELCSAILLERYLDPEVQGG